MHESANFRKHLSINKKYRLKFLIFILVEQSYDIHDIPAVTTINKMMRTRSW